MNAQPPHALDVGIPCQFQVEGQWPAASDVSRCLPMERTYKVAASTYVGLGLFTAGLAFLSLIVS